MVVYTPSVDLERARYLVSQAGRAAVEAADTSGFGGTIVELSVELRRTHPPAVAAALGEQVVLRRRARQRDLPAEGWLYSAEGQQMVTPRAVATRRAARLSGLGERVVDLTCGLGGDLGALAEAGVDATGLERDFATALLARSNMNGVAQVVRGDAIRPPFDTRRHAVVLDPSRREGARRRFDPAAFSPPWDACLEIAASARAAVIKTAPGIDDRQVPPSAEVEFVQLGRSLREAALWFGEMAEPGLRRAVLLPEGACLDSTAPECGPEPAPIGRYLVDPEGCITRAGLVRHLAAGLDGRLIDSHLAYITMDELCWTPFGTTFEVLGVLKFSVRGLRETARARRWRIAEIRRRAFPVEPDELWKLLPRVDGEPVSLLCTTIAGRRTVVVGRRVVDETAGQ